MKVIFWVWWYTHLWLDLHLISLSFILFSFLHWHQPHNDIFIICLLTICFAMKGQQQMVQSWNCLYFKHCVTMFNLTATQCLGYKLDGLFPSVQRTGERCHKSCERAFRYSYQDQQTHHVYFSYPAFTLWADVFNHPLASLRETKIRGKKENRSKTWIPHRELIEILYRSFTDVALNWWKTYEKLPRATAKEKDEGVWREDTLSSFYAMRISQGL